MKNQKCPHCLRDTVTQDQEEFETEFGTRIRTVEKCQACGMWESVKNCLTQSI